MISQQQQERERQRQEQKQRLYNMVRTGRQLNNYWNNRDKFGFNKPNPNALTSNASTNTIANYASPNMAAAPSINNPATYNMSTQLGGATTPTLSNASAGTTLSNFGTQGATAMNGGAMASSTPIAGAVASEASGAGMGLANTGMSAIGTEAATTAGAGTLAGTGATTAGTSAAMGGAGAAGAAGGAAAGASAAIPVVGWAALAAATIYNMIKSAQKKKQQKAMEQDLKAVQQNEQLSNENTNAALQDMANSAAQKREQLKQEVANNLQQDQGYSGQLPDFGNDALKQNLMQEATAPQQPSSPETYTPQGALTGAAANVDDMASNISGMVQDNLPIDTTPVQPVTTDEGSDRRGMIDNLMSFFGDAGKGYQENNSTRFSPENLKQDTYTTREQGFMPTNQEVDAYADELRKNKVKEDVINAFLTEGKNSGNKDIAQWVDAHQDLRDENGGWKPTEAERDIEHKKSLAYRLGEGLGTANRVLSKPLTQGLIATGAYMADGESPLYALGKGIEYGSNKARSDAYRKLVTGDDSASIFGGYSEKDLNALTNQEYKRIMGEVAKQRVDETGRHNRVTEGQNDTKIKNQADHWGRQDNIAQQRVDVAKTSNVIRQMGINLRVNQLNDKGKKAAELNKDFNFFLTKIGAPGTSDDKKNFLEGRMIEKYGADFYKLYGAYNNAHKNKKNDED